VTKARRIAILVGMGLLSNLASGTRAWGQANAGKFAPPDVGSATDVAYPVNTTTTGMVSLVLSLDNGGKVQNVQVVADTPPLTAAARASVQNWTFHAARENGNGIGTNLPVSVVFNPYNPGGTSRGSGALTPPPVVTGNGRDYVGPQIRLASYAFYPINSVVNGTVVLSVGVDASGHVSHVTVVHGMHPLNDAAVTAVKQWGFQPATQGGHTVAGKICIAFVFQRNLN
jgi:TonB family protein